MDTSSIFTAIRAGDTEAVRDYFAKNPALLQLKNLDKEAWDEISPLHCAAKHGQLEIVKLLVEAGAEIYSNPMCTYPPVIVAAWNKHQPVVDYFLREIPDRAEGTNKLGVTINLAAREGWIDIVRAHIAADPLAVHQRGWIGDTPLHWPAHNGYTEIVELLLDAGAAIEADEINCYGGKPLHWASEHEPATTELLLRRGADVNSRNVRADSEMFGFTPLIMNARQRQDCAEVTQLLLDAGADRSLVDAKGKTALDEARARGNRRIASVLERA